MRRDDDLSTQLDVVVSTEHDVEVRRLTLTNHGDRMREIEVTSYVEVALAKPEDDFAHPAFGKLFLETEYLPESTALLCHRRPRDSRDAGDVGDPRDEPRRPHPGRRRVGNGPDALHRPWPERREPGGRSMAGRCQARPGPSSIRCSASASVSGCHRRASVRLSFATGVAPNRETAAALAQTYRDPRGASRSFLLALAHAQSGRRHLDISEDEAVLFERLASRVLFTDGSLRARPATLASNELGQSGLWPHGISGDIPILLVRVVGDDVALVRQALQAQEYWRLKGLSADVVILNEHPVSYLDEMHTRLTALLDDGPWRTWKHQRGGAYLLRGDLMGQAERTLLQTVACAILDGGKGDLRAHLDSGKSERHAGSR